MTPESHHLGAIDTPDDVVEAAGVWSTADTLKVSAFPRTNRPRP